MPRRSKKKGAPTQQEAEQYHRITVLEGSVLEQIEKAKRTHRRSRSCEHSNLQRDAPQPYNPTANYYDAFWKQFLYNQYKKQLIIKVERETEQLQASLQKIQTLMEKHSEEMMATQRRPSTNKITTNESHFKSDEPEQKMKVEKPAEEINQDDDSYYDVSEDSPSPVRDDYG